MRQTRIFLLLVVLCLSACYAIPPIDKVRGTFPEIGYFSNNTDLADSASILYQTQRYAEALVLLEKALQKHKKNPAPVLKKIALSHSALGHTGEAIQYIEEYLQVEFDSNILMDEGFDTIRTTAEFIDIQEKYAPHFTFWSFLYLYIALIGFYTAIVLNFNKRIDVVARILISGFILIHSSFILNIFFNITNYQYVYPHSYLMSTAFSFLYGPLLYFYFKRITQRYAFRKIDLLHLIPTVLFLFYIVPIYTMSAEEKLNLMLGRAAEGQVATDSAYLYLIVGLKLASLLIYGFFSRKLYLKAKHDKVLSRANKLWQRNIYLIHISYVIVYAIYGVVISNEIVTGFLYHSQIICMSAMVLFLGLSANLQPSVFSGLLSFENSLFFKYEKSGLTQSFSEELKQNLMRLFDVEKIYRENDINLQSLADRLNTTRHNTSQVINEHFDMNFHELINKYRIQEAKYMLGADAQRNLNIIDIAYEVGFNNKVTFNKAFKKDTKLTPSEYQRVSASALG
ncbi:helix-turn-helix domain-containing protein [Aggregatimonas sangjinii]|uniref:Helix-turn-helix domain-containing protein n=1 Tax=Aggregatimonas sangjinii TaxID=2583587 RepID=A0A5B7SVI0_9FLAO|nr:AraC family transcriptional regulator [Aggregatimonas sangjinii]QCX00850.1 helix-turn-helix domain-containing protein [Aggregatimonas sangjinii]